MNRRELLSGLLLVGALGASGLSWLSGCGVPVATWIQLGTSLLATVLPTIPALIQTFGTLVGKNILTAAQQAKLQQIFSNVQDLLMQANTALEQYQASNDPTIITKIQTILVQVRSSLSSIVTDVGITNPQTAAKITLLATSYIDLANNILAVLPIVSGGKVSARKVSKARMKSLTAEAWSEEFNNAAHSTSGNNELDKAFDKVKAVPVKK